MRRSLKLNRIILEECSDKLEDLQRRSDIMNEPERIYVADK
jgi:hypothetical protein